MKTNELRKLALMGMAAGLMTVSQSGLNASEDTTAIDVEQLIARPKCNSGDSCGGLTALRNPNKNLIPSDDELDPDEDEESDDEEEVHGYGA